jgi:DNA topoisomerase-1
MDATAEARSNVIALEVQSRAAARAAGLRYCDDRGPGIRRERKRSGFSYFDAAGRRISDPQTQQRIRSLAIPPAWTNVWICPHENGHLQATGRDARGRKQYRYHSAWSDARNLEKHRRICDFASRLAPLRTHCEAALESRGLSREKVMAALLRVIDLTAIRVGHEAYTRENASFGLTTLRTRHARIRGAQVELCFRGKSGILRKLTFRDTRLAKIVAACRALGGPHLFQYVDSRGTPRPVDAAQLNAYLRSLAGRTYSVKDFRTWAATVCVAVELRLNGPANSQRAARKALLEAIRKAASHLGNTPTVCRKSYVHPLIIDAYMEGKTLPARKIAVAPGGDYHAHENAVRQFLLQLLKQSPRLALAANRRGTLRKAS